MNVRRMSGNHYEAYPGKQMTAPSDTWLVEKRYYGVDHHQL